MGTPQVGFASHPINHVCSILGEVGAELKVFVLGLPTVTNSFSQFFVTAACGGPK